MPCQQKFAHTPQNWAGKAIKEGKLIRQSRCLALEYWHLQTQSTMLYDTYGEEYLTFLRELNEILSVNELVEVDYL